MQAHAIGTVLLESGKCRETMIAGLTGHQNIGNERTVRWVEQQLAAALIKRDVTGGWMSLAIGADQMYARLMLGRGLPYSVVIPCKRYEETFSELEREEYFYLLSRAKSVVTLAFIEPSETAFYEAGKEVVKRSKILIAIWNGMAAQGLGGTADIVEFARTLSKPVLQIDTVSHVVRDI
jgi:hypothetical protein